MSTYQRRNQNVTRRFQGPAARLPLCVYFLFFFLTRVMSQHHPPTIPPHAAPPWSTSAGQRSLCLSANRVSWQPIWADTDLNVTNISLRTPENNHTYYYSEIALQCLVKSNWRMHDCDRNVPLQHLCSLHSLMNLIYGEQLSSIGSAYSFYELIYSR